MNKLGTGLGVVAAASASLALWLWRDNARLRGELTGARTEIVSVRERAETAEHAATVIGSRAADRPGRESPLAVMGAIGRALDRAGDAPPGAGDAPRPPDDWEARRDARMQRVRDLLGRRAGETDEEYRARVVPLVEAVLAVPRERMNEKRRQFEEAAGLDDDQRARLDAAFAEAQNDVLGLANTAIASGELTPYERNSRGILNFVGSTTGAVDALDGRLRQILTPEQLRVMQESGFDPLEYLGTSTPWETLAPPPPPPTPGG